LIGFAVQIQLCSLTGSYVMATAEHREPYESRGSRTVLGAPGGGIPPGDSTQKRKGSQRVHVFRSAPIREADIDEIALVIH
jgi:methylmalonyl-CoA mutase cobalamin-binding subunit